MIYQALYAWPHSGVWLHSLEVSRDWAIPTHGHSSSSLSVCFLFAGALAGVADLHVGATPGPLLHDPTGMAPPGVLGLGTMASYRASVSAATWVGKRGACLSGLGLPCPPLTLCLLLSRPQQMNQFPVGGQPSSSLQDPPQLYSSASQPQFPLPPGIQQVLGAWGDTELRGRHPWDLSEPQFTHLEHGDNIPHQAHVLGSVIQFPPKNLQWAKTRLSPGVVNPTSHLAFQDWGWGGVIVSDLCSLSPSFSLPTTPCPCLWEVPSRGPVWLPVWGTTSLPPTPHGCAFISGTAPQTLPQAHLLIQVRSRAG